MIKKIALSLLIISLLTINLFSFDTQDFEVAESFYITACQKILEDEAMALTCQAFQEYYRAKGKKLEEEANNIQPEIDKINEDIEQLGDKVLEFKNIIDGLENQRNSLVQSITQINNNIEQLQILIKRKSQEINQRNIEIARRMLDNQMFINGNRQYDFLINAQNFDDLLRRMSIVQQILENDKIEYQNLKKIKKELENQNKEIIRQKELLEASRKEVEAKTSAIIQIKQKYDQLLKVGLDKKAELEAKMREKLLTANQINNITKNINTSFSAEDYANVIRANNNGEIILPFKYRPPISAGTWYYPSSFGGGMHLGIDFSPGFGTEVIAPANALILFASGYACEDNGYLGNGCGNPWGGGNSIVLATNINNRTYIISFYHLQYGSVYIEGDRSVAKGRVMAHVGSSGNVTGPHTHVEVIDLGNSSLEAAATHFKNNLDFSFGAGWSLSSVCGSVPCRIRPEEFFNLE